MFKGSLRPPLPQKERNPDDLKISIQTLVEELEANPGKPYSILEMSSKFKIKRRRLYDVINVFLSIGCCVKESLENIVWVGRDKISQTLISLRRNREIDNKTLTLSELFPVTGCVGIVNLTICFILIYYALDTDRLDLRFVGQFFSRFTTRYKTTLCKLYQISYILGALGLTKRTTQVCEVMLNRDLIMPAEIPPSTEPYADCSIEALLNRPAPSNMAPVYKSRREELDNCTTERVP